jgi:hypothetical protein
MRINVWIILGTLLALLSLSAGSARQRGPGFSLPHAALPGPIGLLCLRLPLRPAAALPTVQDAHESPRRAFPSLVADGTTAATNAERSPANRARQAAVLLSEATAFRKYNKFNTCSPALRARCVRVQIVRVSDPARSKYHCPDPTDCI